MTGIVIDILFKAENLRIQVSKLKESQKMNSNYGSSNHSNAGGDSSVGNSISWSPNAPSSSSSATKVKSESLAQSSSSNTLVSSFSSNSDHDTKQRKLPSFDSMQQQQSSYKLENGSNNNDSDSCQEYSNNEGDMDQSFERQSSAASSVSSSASIQRYNPSKYIYYLT
jgi:hypothetical protein